MLLPGERDRRWNKLKERLHAKIRLLFPVLHVNPVDKIKFWLNRQRECCPGQILLRARDWHNFLTFLLGLSIQRARKMSNVCWTVVKIQGPVKLTWQRFLSGSQRIFSQVTHFTYVWIHTEFCNRTWISLTSILLLFLIYLHYKIVALNAYDLMWAQWICVISHTLIGKTKTFPSYKKDIPLRSKIKLAN